MASMRRSRDWWRETVGQFRRGGMTAEAFAKARGLNVSTLRWWVYELGREEPVAGESAPRFSDDSESIVPLRVDLSSVIGAQPMPRVEVVVGEDLVVRLFDAAEPSYVAELVRRLQAEPC